MVKHIILWKIDSKYSEEEKEKIKTGIKSSLEGLLGKVPGLIEIKVNTDGISSSTEDLMLDSTFESKDALASYAINPIHVAAADTYVRPFTLERSCFDFEI